LQPPALAARFFMRGRIGGMPADHFPELIAGAGPIDPMAPEKNDCANVRPITIYQLDQDGASTAALIHPRPARPASPALGFFYARRAKQTPAGEVQSYRGSLVSKDGTYFSHGVGTKVTD